MKYQLSNPNSSIVRKLSLLKKAINKRLVVRPKDVSKFVFLCGANKPNGEVSERRFALLNFARKNLSHTQFFLAEKIFPLIQKEGHKGNLLDIENDISRFADNILIVLESNSCFAELGAFAHKDLRNKLIVINDIKYKAVESFINFGPIKSIEESSGKDHIVYYNMNEDGVVNLDSIGSTYTQLYNLLKDPLTEKPIPFNSADINPGITFNKDSLRFVHDLIYMSGPITKTELIYLLKLLFGDKFDFKKVAEHLAMLNAFDAVIPYDNKTYKSKLHSPYFVYKFDINAVISSFRNYMMKNKPERIYGT